jgi:two-component sensor histidine kinase
VGVALLIRAARLLQALFTLVFGYLALQRPAAIAGVGIALAWSIYLSRVSWRRPGVNSWEAVVDVLVALLALATAALSTPVHLITTSFYWALPYAQSSAVVVGVSRLSKSGTAVAVLLTGSYGAAIVLVAGEDALLTVAGNALAIVGFYAVAVVIALGVRRLAGNIDHVQRVVRTNEEDMVVRRVRLEEFRRLHDEAVQVLEQVAKLDQPITPQVRNYARKAADRLHQAMRGTTDQAPLGLTAQLTLLASDFEELGFTVDLSLVSPPPTLPQESASLLTDAAREAISNAYKHSAAGRARVSLTTREGGIVLAVVDSGIGFEMGTGRRGFGMQNSLTGRIEEAGGDVKIRSSPGAGTAVTIWLPC